MQNKEDDFSHGIYNNNFDHLIPYENFLFALKSKETRRQYPKLLKMFFDFINIEPAKPIEERAAIVYEKAKGDIKWFESQIFRYVIYNKQKVENKQITAGTLKKTEAPKFDLEGIQMLYIDDPSKTNQQFFLK